MDEYKEPSYKNMTITQVIDSYQILLIVLDIVK